MKTIYDIIRKAKLIVPEKLRRIGLQINPLGITETGREAYLIMTDDIRLGIQYDRENDDFYTQEWVKVDEKDIDN